MNPLIQRVLGASLGAAVASGDGPWRAKSVLAVLLVVLAGMGFWVRDGFKQGASAGTGSPGAAAGVVTATNAPGVGAEAAPAGLGGWDFRRPVPAYIRWGASYVGGFFIGWIFRRLLRIVLALGAAALAVVGTGKVIGWNTAPAETRVRQGTEWVHRETKSAGDYLKNLLPSGSAAGVGAFLGWRRRGKKLGPEPRMPPPPAAT